MQALLILDMLNDFVRCGATLEVPGAETIVLNIKKQIETARANKIPVIYVNDAHDKTIRSSTFGRLTRSRDRKEPKLSTPSLLARLIRFWRKRAISVFIGRNWTNGFGRWVSRN